MHIGELILKTLEEKERPIAWLARKINCNDANLGRLLKNSQHIHSELLLRISIVLEEDFFKYYSEIVKEKNCKFYSEMV
jgi:plasmid maintenance system antidote protein VapI